MIIIEGTDLVGKTTFAHELNDYLPDHIYQHLSRPPEYFDHYNGYLGLHYKKSIRDRFYLSDVAYNIACNQTPNVSPMGVKELDTLLRAFTIVIYTEACLLEERFKEHGLREMYDLKTILKANHVYGNFSKYGYLPKINYFIECAHGKPWPTELDVQNILQLYRKHG